MIAASSRIPRGAEGLSVNNVRIEEYAAAQPFDLVLCEGLVGASGHSDPGTLIRSVAAHVRMDGVLVLTCIEYVAYLSEMLRRLLGIELAGRTQALSERTAALLPVFAPHLDSLRGMTRRHDDWIIDNLINPASVEGLVTLDDCVRHLAENFDVLSTSPRFIVDWAWYKEAAAEAGFFNRVALECYWRNVHNFMDYRSIAAPRPEAENRSSTQRCAEIHHQIRAYEGTRSASVRQQIVANVRALQREVTAGLPAVAEALAEVDAWLSAPRVDADAVRDSRKFGTWFGRAATYVSLVRRA